MGRGLGLMGFETTNSPANVGGTISQCVSAVSGGEYEIDRKAEGILGLCLQIYK
jgi:hypothetical protein